MTALLLLIFLFFFLFFLSRTLTRAISGLLLSITRHQKITVYILALLFFPGTVLHEVAHYLMACLLVVPAGNMVLFPRLEGNGVRLGSVAIQKTDPFRRMLIGVAPFLFGSTILFCLLALALKEEYPIISFPMFAIGYVVFEIGNTMFSSKKDMEGAIELIGAFLILGILLYIFGLRIPEEFFIFLNSSDATTLFQKGSILIGVPILLDLFIIVSLSFIKKVLTK